MPAASFHVFAPAKINLFLHITGRRDDGYHTLQSLVVFGDTGDDLAFFPQKDFELQITGPFADVLEGDNIVSSAAQFLAEEYKIPRSGKIVLTKNLPVASGIGGGSADAAAALKGLVKLWGLPEEPARLQKIALMLGADVPACLDGRTVMMEGIGEKLTPMPDVPPLHLVLVNPLVPVTTAQVFGNFSGPFITTAAPGDLKSCRNDLTAAAIKVAPVISDVLKAIDSAGCLFSRMSGSGATCFGVYNSAHAAMTAAEQLKAQHSAWWVTFQKAKSKD